MRTRPDGGGETPPVGEEPGVGEEEIVDDTEGAGAEDEGAQGDAGGDAGEDEPQAEDEEVVGEPAPRHGGGSQTIRAQRARAQEAERKAAALEAELRGYQAGAAARQPAPDPQAAVRANAEFYQSLQYMSEEQKFEAVVNRERQQIGAVIQQLQFNQNDLADQTRFEASCARSPVREAYREKVEAYRQQQLRRGFICSREEAFYLVYGPDVEARANKTRPGQTRAAAARVAGQRTAPTGARSNVSPGGRRPQPGSAEADWTAFNAAVARGE